MSQKYKFKSLQFEEGEKDKKETVKELTVFETGEARVIDLVLLDGTRQNFPYAHYHTAWLGKEDNERLIKIFFATHLVTIRGYCLEPLYDELVQQSVTSIQANDERYADMVEEDKTFVTDIKITWKKEEEK